MRSRRRSLRVGLGLVLGYAATLAIVGIVLTLWSRHQDLEAIHAALEEAKPALAIWRLVLYAALVAAWPRLCRRLADERLGGQRWQVAIGLLLYELLLVQNIPGRLTVWALGPE